MSKRSCERVAAGLLSLALSACATPGTEGLRKLETQSPAQMLTPGKTTQAEVEQQLGKGQTLVFASGWSTWLYQSEKQPPKVLNYIPWVNLLANQLKQDGTELVLLFDDKGVLRKYRRSHPSAG